MQIAVVGDRNRGLFELQRLGNEVVYPVRSVEERIFGMAVEVYKAHSGF